MFDLRHDWSGPGGGLHIEARLKGSVVGRIDVQPPGFSSHNEFSIWAFYVEEPLRSRGIGRVLLHTAIDYCKMKGAPRVVLRVYERNTKAKRLYERVGFSVAKPATHEDDYNVMVKELTGGVP
jgi:ribosomal protein S18 acetylase RimI-like enzyme